MCKIVQNVRNVQNYAKFAKLYKICRIVQFCKIPKNGEYCAKMGKNCGKYGKLSKMCKSVHPNTHLLTRLTCIVAIDVNLTLQYLKSDLK